MADEHPDQPATAKSGMGKFLESHKWVAVGSIAAVIVVFIALRSRSSVSNNNSTSQTGCTDVNGNPVSCSDVNAVNQQGSLGAAGAQSAQTATALNMLQTQLNNLAATVSQIGNQPGPTGPAGPTGPQGPSGSSAWVAPLIPYSQTWSGKHYFPVAPGHRFDWQGVSYWITSNTNGVIQGVPGATSAGTAAGKNPVVLYGPSSTYKPPVTNTQANHSPLLSSLMLSRTAQGGQDLSHPGISGGPMQWNPVSRIGHTWNYQ